MKKYIINKCYDFVLSVHPEYDNLTKDKLKYGLESLYILITKLIFISLVALILNMFKEMLIFLLLYNVIRMPSFGLHATKSWMCLVSSTLIFILVPLFCDLYTVPINIKIILGVIAIILVMKNAPADTYKRPIVNPIRRRNYKIISIIVAIGLVIASISIEDNFLSNSCLFALVVQCFMISPYVYKIFKLPYNNYLRYQTNWFKSADLDIWW